MGYNLRVIVFSNILILLLALFVFRGYSREVFFCFRLYVNMILSLLIFIKVFINL